MLGLWLATSAASTQDFGGFLKEPINAPGSYQVVANPTGTGPSGKVHRFHIKPGPGSSKSYDNLASDCDFNSIRAQAYEKGKSQPAEAWYGWSMYVPGDFPMGRGQPAGGHLALAYWHSGECPHLEIAVPEGSTRLILQSRRMQGKSCMPGDRITLGDLGAWRGRWLRVEMHVRWSKAKDGLAEAHIDGRKVGTIAGPTLTTGVPNKNYFKFGLYLCCTSGTKGIAPATAYFADLTRAKTRAGLSP